MKVPKEMLMVSQYYRGPGIGLHGNLMQEWLLQILYRGASDTMSQEVV